MKKPLITLAFILFSLFFFSVVKDRPQSPNDLNFLAGIIAWGRYGEPSIDKTIQKVTIDKAFYKGKFYSSKPPFLIWILGKSLNIVFRVVKAPLLANDIPFYMASTYLTSTIPIIIMVLILFLLFIREERISYVESGILSLVFPFSTLFLSYSQYLNTHIITAWPVFVLFLMFSYYKKLTLRIYCLSIGFLFSLILALEPSFFLIVVIASSPFLLRSLQRNVKGWLYVLLGFVPIAFAHFYLNYLSFEVLYPVQLNMRKYFGYPGSHLYGIKDPLDINVYRSPFLILLFNNLFGTHGIFLYMPVLIFFFLYKNKKESGWIFTLLLLIISTVAYSIFSPNFGGWSYGNRRLIPLIPLLYYFSAKYVINSKRKIIWGVFLVLALISMFFSYLGFKNTWYNKKLHINRDFAYFPLLYNLNKDYLKGKIPYDP